jgi:hypothetical protein
MASNSEIKKLTLGDLEQFGADNLIKEIVGPDWLAALEKLETDGDASELSNLLNQYAPPSWIAKEIGKMLSPPKGYRGAQLRVNLPTKSRQAAFAELTKKHNAHLLILEYERRGYGTESAVAEVMNLTGYGRSSLFDIKAMDFEKEFNRIMGNTEVSSKN